MQAATRSHVIPKAGLLFLLTLFFCVGCAGPTLTSRFVQEESTWFVRLDSFGATGDSGAHYDHPATWTAGDLSAILSRLLLEDRVGLMDSPQQPRVVFSMEEIAFLAPAIKESFERATPHEWISFFTSVPSGSGVVVTSGGIFLNTSQFHLVLANHRTLLGKESDDLAAVRGNPFRSVRGSGGALAFESSRYVVRRQANWSGGHRASASELVLDHRSFLAILQRTGTIATPSSLGKAAPLIPSHASTSGGVATPEADSKTIILQLEQEIEQLKRKVAEQEGEITRLKRNH